MREDTMLQKLWAGDPAGLEALMERYIPYVSAVVWNIRRRRFLALFRATAPSQALTVPGRRSSR